MFITLLLKEIQETLVTVRFIVLTVICILLIPLWIFVSLKDYEQRFDDYNREMQLYQDRSEGNVNARFQAEGYRPPSPLGLFSIGIKDLLPHRTLTSRNGDFNIEKKPLNTDPQSALFGKIDFVFIVSFILSILVFIFTFSCISGEKERGTIRLVMSNGVPRWQIVLAKIIGNYLVFLAPLIISFIIGLVIINITGIISIFIEELFIALIIISIITLLFLFTIFNLGIFISTLTHNSTTSIITLILIWVFFILVIPKVSPMISGILYPLKSQQIFEIEKRMLKESIEDELDNQERELFERLVAESGMDIYTYYDLHAPETENAREKYDELVIPLQNEYKDKISSELTKIENQYQNKKSIQAAIAVNFSRVSPISCYTYIIAELSGTGNLELENFYNYSKNFQSRVKQEIYDHWTHQVYKAKHGGFRSSGGYFKKEGVVEDNIPVPHFSSYKHAGFNVALQSVWIDIVLLILYSFLFFYASFVSFLRYDVR